MKNTPVRLLVVDDEEELVEVLTAADVGPDVKLMGAVTAKEAIKLLDQVDAVIADRVMPGVKELDAAVQMKGLPLARISGHPDSDLVKPFSTTEFKEFISDFVAKIFDDRKKKSA